MKNTDITIIDVRSEGEFVMGHAQNAINIPLNNVEAKAEEISNMKGEIVLCCASGNRSGMAQQILESKGVKCHNGGSWFASENYAMAL